MVIGVGLNVATPEDALPVSPTGLPATSLLAEGVLIGREPLLIEILRHLERRYLSLRSDPDPARTGLLGEYRSLCGTLGRAVRVELPSSRALNGTAVDIDAGGQAAARGGTRRRIPNTGLRRRRRPSTLS